MNIIRNNRLLLSVIFVSIFFLIDLGNLNAIRQGTEGFYLQISHEMFENLSFLTPTYMNNNHWSKPPLHFWLAQPFYALAGESNIFEARLSILLLSIFIVYFIANWIFRHFNIEKYISFLFIFSSIGMLKYSRIYMMETPLSLMSTMSALLFFDYLKYKKLKYLLIGSLILGLSILIKGPVSFVMITGGLFIYLVFLYFSFKENHIKSFLYLSTLSLLIGSIWFIRSYMEYGQDFIQYFFIRENLGKFNSKPYPIRHVFQGLVLYALPWSLYIFSFIFRPYFKHLKEELNAQQLKNKKYYFLLINFTFYFVLWLIPNQRSHHYAIPALPFFLMLLLVLTVSIKEKFVNFGKVTNRFISVFFILLILILGLSLNFAEFTQNLSSIINIFIAAILSITSVYFFWVNFSLKYLIIISFSTISYIWIVITPLFILPKVPANIKSYLDNKKVAAFVHKPYFLEKALGRKFMFVSQNKMYKHILGHPNINYYVHESVYTKLNLGNIATIEKRWHVWSRGRRMHHIISALKSGNLSELKEEIFIIKPKRLVLQN